MNLNGYVDLGTSTLFGPTQKITDGNGNDYQVPSGTGTVTIQFRPTTTYYFSKSSGTSSVKVTMVDVNDLYNTLELFTFSVNASSTQKDGGIPLTAVEKNLSQFAGKYIGVKFSIVNASPTGTYPQLANHKMPIIIKSPYTAVTSGNKCMTGDITQTGASVTAGTVMSNSHFSAGTKIEASTFNSQVLGL